MNFVALTIRMCNILIVRELSKIRTVLFSLVDLRFLFLKLLKCGLRCKILMLKPVRHKIYLAWDPPPPNYAKSKVDGSIKSGKGCSCANGVLRAAAGEWIACFTINVCVGSVLNAELCGLFHGRSLAWRLL